MSNDTNQKSIKTHEEGGIMKIPQTRIPIVHLRDFFDRFIFRLFLYYKGEHSFELHSTLSEIKKVLDKIVEAQQEYDREKRKSIN